MRSLPTMIPLPRATLKFRRIEFCANDYVVLLHAVPHSILVLRAQDPPPTFMSSTSGGVDPEFQAWLHTNGLHAPKDFKLAFTSAQKAFEACPTAPEAAASAWISISHNEVEVASSWALWIKSRRRDEGRMPTKSHDTKPAFKIWRGVQN